MSDGWGWVSIRTFEDQDRDRRIIGRICERITAEMILLMDLVTSPGGIDELTESKELAAEAVGDYLKFREFYGPHLCSAIRVACGRVLEAVEVDSSGRARLSMDRVGKMPDIDRRAGLASRLQWLVLEIPHQQAVYEQLHPEEAEAAMKLVEEVDALDLADERDYARAQKAWPELEHWYWLSCKGALIARGDPRAVEQAKEYIARVEKHLAEQEEQIAAERAMIEGEVEPETAEERQMTLNMVTRDLDEARSRQNKIADALTENARRQRFLEGRREQLLAAAP